MAGGVKGRKRVEAETAPFSTSLKRARDGSAFARCEECNKDVPVALISMHSCSLEAKIQMNLEAQVVEMAAEIKKKTVERKKPKEPKAKEQSGRKGKNDSNKLKRPPTAFFVFMAEFRKSFMEAHPDCKKVSTVAKEGGEKWKSLTEEEKKPYIERAAELKAEYGKALESQKAAEAENDDEGDTNDDGGVSDKEMKVDLVSDDE